MKVEIKEQPQQVERKYPYVGRWEQTIVLFVNEKTGIVLNNNPIYQEGHFAENWAEDLFTHLPPNSVTITI